MINNLGEENSLNYSLYPSSEDIYNKEKKEGEVKPDVDADIVDPLTKIVDWHDNEFDPDSKRNSLDVPGAELDDKAEEIGEEDEENNYYSIGGDNHNNLEEDSKD